MNKMRRFKKGDILLVSLVGLIGALLFFWSYFNVGSQPSNSLIAVVTREGKQIAEIDLNKVQETQYVKIEDGIKLTIEAEKGRIRVLDADCPDKICVKYGWLTKPGDQAICLPSKTIVKIKGEGKIISLLAKQVVIYE